MLLSFDWNLTEYIVLDTKVTEEYMNVYKTIRETKLTTVEYFKRKLGKQTKCQILGSESQRFWIWEFDNWQLLANNQKGYIIETSVDRKEAAVIWECFLNKLRGNNECQ